MSEPSQISVRALWRMGLPLFFIDWLPGISGVSRYEFVEPLLLAQLVGGLEPFDARLIALEQLASGGAVGVVFKRARKGFKVGARRPLAAQLRGHAAHAIGPLTLPL